MCGSPFYGEPPSFRVKSAFESAKSGIPPRFGLAIRLPRRPGAVTPGRPSAHAGGAGTPSRPLLDGHAGIIDRTQFSLLATVVVASAIVPTAVAQRWFSPDAAPARA
jgi:hypothetical protein